MIAGIYAGLMKATTVAPPPPPPPPPPPSGVAVSIDPQIVEKIGTGINVVQATYTLNSDGKVYNHANLILENWLDLGTASACEARVTLQTGTLTSGTVGTWQSLGTTRSWTRNASAGQDTNCQFLVEIRDTATGTILDNAVIELSVLNTGVGGGGGGGPEI